MSELQLSGELKDAQGAKKVVLVIDGKVKRQFYTSIHLQRMDYDVITARTAEDALLFLERQAERYGAGPEDRRAWADLCHVLINVKEFIFIN